VEATTATGPSPTVGPLVASIGMLVVAVAGIFAADSVDGWNAVVVATCLPFLAAATWVDLRELRIPNRLNALFAATVIEGLILSLLLFMIAFFALLVMQRREGRKAMA